MTCTPILSCRFIAVFLVAELLEDNHETDYHRVDLQFSKLLLHLEIYIADLK